MTNRFLLPDRTSGLVGLVVMAAWIAFPLGSQAATILVNSAADAAVPMDGQCTLREAIGAANVNLAPPGADCAPGDPAPTQDVIEFAIPGAGVHTIQPATDLPEIMETLLIDGYSQPGASPNSLVIGSDAVLLIEIDGFFDPHPSANSGYHPRGARLRGARFGDRQLL